MTVKKIFIQLSFCDVVLEWLSWSSWSQCSVTCGWSHEKRQRDCVDVSIDPSIAERLLHPAYCQKIYANSWPAEIRGCAEIQCPGMTLIVEISTSTSRFQPCPSYKVSFSYSQLFVSVYCFI